MVKAGIYDFVDIYGDTVYAVKEITKKEAEVTTVTFVSEHFDFAGNLLKTVEIASSNDPKYNMDALALNPTHSCVMAALNDKSYFIENLLTGEIVKLQYPTLKVKLPWVAQATNDGFAFFLAGTKNLYRIDCTKVKSGELSDTLPGVTMTNFKHAKSEYIQMVVNGDKIL